MGDRCPKRADAMKKLALPLAFAVLSMLAPAVLADGGKSADSVGQLVARVIAIFVGAEDEAEDPSGISGKAGDPSEIGELFPPFG
jgi:hypothetical protein